MKRIAIALCLFGTFALGALAHAQQYNRQGGGMRQNPDLTCQDEMAKKRDRLQSLNQCIGVWQKGFAPNQAEPRDTCTGELNSFIEAARKAHQCNSEMAKQRNRR